MRASVERRSREIDARNEVGSQRRKQIGSLFVPLPYSHVRGHLRVSHVLLDERRKKRDC